jgi:hypothetical protein
MRDRDFFGEVSRAYSASFKQHARVDAIRKDRLEPAERAPIFKGGEAAKKRFHEDLMIAAQQGDACLLRARDEEVYDPLGIGAAVDVVADIDFQRAIARASLFDIAIDQAMRQAKTVGPAMDIADGIKGESVRSRRVAKLATAGGP